MATCLRKLEGGGGLLRQVGGAARSSGAAHTRHRARNGFGPSHLCLRVASAIGCRRIVGGVGESCGVVAVGCDELEHLSGVSESEMLASWLWRCFVARTQDSTDIPVTPTNPDTAICHLAGSCVSGRNTAAYETVLHHACGHLPTQRLIEGPCPPIPRVQRHRTGHRVGHRTRARRTVRTAVL